MSAHIGGGDIAVEILVAGVWHDVSCDFMNARWTHGASTDAGPLTRVNAAVLELTLNDPDRVYDPFNLAGPYAVNGVSQLRPMLEIRVTAARHGQQLAPMFYGFVESWTRVKIEDNPFAQITASDGTRILNNIFWPTTFVPVGDGDNSLARLNRILDTNHAWPSWQRRLQNWGPAMTPTSFGSALWPMILATADAASGFCYFDTDGYIVSHPDWPTTVPTETWDLVGACYITVDVANDDTLFYNEVHAKSDRTIKGGGSPPDQVAKDQASIDSYRAHVYPPSGPQQLPIKADTDVNWWCHHILDTSNVLEPRVERLHTDLVVFPDDGTVDAALGSRFGDLHVIHIPDRVGEAGYNTQLVRVRGLAHDITFEQWDTQIVYSHVPLAPAPASATLTLGALDELATGDWHMNLTWTPPGSGTAPTGYRVFVYENGVQKFQSDNLSPFGFMVAANTVVYAEVAALAGQLESRRVVSNTITTPPLPPAQTPVLTYANHTGPTPGGTYEAHLAWSDPPVAVTFPPPLYAWSLYNDTGTLISSGKIASSPVVVPGWPEGATWHFTVWGLYGSAQKPSGGVVSAPVTAPVTGPAPPGDPAPPISVVQSLNNISGATVNAWATLTWPVDVSNVATADVEVSLNSGAWFTPGAGSGSIAYPATRVNLQLAFGVTCVARMRTRNAAGDKVSAWVNSAAWGLPVKGDSVAVTTQNLTASATVTWTDPAQQAPGTTWDLYSGPYGGTLTLFGSYPASPGAVGRGVSVTGLVADTRYQFRLRPRNAFYAGAEQDVTVDAWTRPTTGTQKLTPPDNADTWTAVNGWKGSNDPVNAGKFSSALGAQYAHIYLNTAVSALCRGHIPASVSLTLARDGSSGYGGQVEIGPGTDKTRQPTPSNSRLITGGAWWNPGVNWSGANATQVIPLTLWKGRFYNGDIGCLILRAPGDSTLQSGYSAFQGYRGAPGWSLQLVVVF